MGVLPSTWREIWELVQYGSKDLLRSLSISASNYQGGPNSGFPGLSLIGVHSLQSLHLNGPSDSDGLATLSGLKELTLGPVNLIPGPTIVSFLVCALSNMLALANLRLFNLPFAAGGRAEPLHTVRVGHLTQLKLVGLCPVFSVRVLGPLHRSPHHIRSSLYA